ncbi:toll/interleukin-1 receptor domain-containing protein [Aggregatilinea lenta]|uniref:toll/interleukin-1 receptor domain-containing protein n=1 Tax=Aggregatilinea lenta TaxID=913108 RepID=UPI000E5BD5D2|nr:toll/interleukin-1 receptor domain-containing protein [Aggregatilinea lenta]
MPPHVYLSYSAQDKTFARQLGIQLQQRGLVVWRVLDTAQLVAAPRDEGAALEAASHVLAILSPHSTAESALLRDWGRALGMHKHVFVVIHETCDIPDLLQPLPRVDFRDRFLLAVEDLVQNLQMTGAPTRPLTVEYPPPVGKSGLLPNTLPSERCWREDRLRINYTLPMILPPGELEARTAYFFELAKFELTEVGPRMIQAHRVRAFNVFDPRRSDQTLIVEQLEGLVMVRYHMTRTQVYYWFPGHYHVLDREAAALYRVLATDDVGPDVLDIANAQAERAQALSWVVLATILLLILSVLLLFLNAVFGVSVF